MLLHMNNALLPAGPLTTRQCNTNSRVRLQAPGRKAEAQLAFAKVSRLQSKANSESILMK